VGKVSELQEISKLISSKCQVSDFFGKKLINLRQIFSAKQSLILKGLVIVCQKIPSFQSKK